MRKTFLFLLLFYAVSCFAQKIYPWDGHIFPFCTDENPYGITYKSGTTGYAAFPTSENVGCLGSTPAPVWYYMQIDQPGDLLIYIEQYSRVGHVPIDVDFACWGPFQAESKRDFLKKLKKSYKLEVGSKGNHRPEGGDHSYGLGGYPYHNLVDCSFDPAGTEWCFIPDAKSGDWYLLLITNFSRLPGKIHFERIASQSTATTRCDLTVPITINPIPKGLKRIDDHTSAVCFDEKKALVTIELEPDEGYSLSEKSLKNTTVEVFANGKKYTAILENGDFVCVIDIENDTTSYYAIVSCPDPAFELQTERHYLIKSTDCIPGEFVANQLETIHAGTISFTDLKQADKPITVTLPDGGDYKNINLDDYEIEVVKDNPFIESVSVSHEGNDLKLWPKLRGDWCECFMPDSLTFHLKLVQKNQSNVADYMVLPITIKVKHQSAWLSRCLWVILTIAGLGLLLFYLWGLLKKNRFKKTGRIKEQHLELNGSRWVMTDWKQGRLLRKKGFAAWVNRWLVPFRDERHTLNWTTSPPHAGSITFVAAELKNKVYMTRESFNATKMRMASFNPNNKNDKRKLLKVDPISIYGNGRCEGELKYDSGGKDDEKIFRIVVVILMVLSAATILSLLFLMLKSIF